VEGDVIALSRTDTTGDDAPSSYQTDEPFLTFKDAPLANVVIAFNRYNHRQIVIDDPSIAGLRIGGKFPKTDPDSFISALTTSFGLQARLEGADVDPGSGTIHLSRAPAGR
jgi:transmembrane sensor